MPESKRERIAAIPLFAGLDPAEIEALAGCTAEKRYKTGAALFHEGEPCNGIYLILEGRVKIFKTSPAGREITLAVETAPACVAEVPLFDGGPYPASVSAIGAVSVAFIDTRDFQNVCRTHPEVSLKLLAAAGLRLRQLVSVIERVTFGSVRQRLAAQLIQLSEEAGAEAFTLPTTHQELASRLGTVREVVSRNLSRFQSDGLIRIAGRQVELRDAAGLRAEAETEF